MEDRIYISNLKVQAIIGIFGWERKVRQEISIDLEIALNSKKLQKLMLSKIPLITKPSLKRLSHTLNHLAFNSKKPLQKASRH